MVPRPDLVFDIASALRAFCDGSATDKDHERLIRQAATLAARRLHGRLGVAARFEGTSRSQLALSVVASLFSRREGPPPIAEALAEHRDLDDLALYLRFQAVVACAAGQELFHRWHENDSLSARLWRSLQRSLRHDDRLALIPAGRPEWVALVGQAHYHPAQPPPTAADLEPIVRFHHTTTGFTGELVVNVLRDLARLEHCAQFVSIELLFSLLRDQTRELAAAELRAETHPATVHPLLSAALHEATTAARIDIATRLERYCAAGKVSSLQATLFARALEDIVADCADGGPAQSYYLYLRNHAHELRLADYRRQWRTRFEYLAESARERFFECLRTQLDPGFLQAPAAAPSGGWKPRESAS